ncbi:MAG: deoxyribodipyrimidine photo-lyase [Methanospirillum sp.]|uniref:deoxyribodipyrimidine photo-lyase n=1 Tax=Methanospirillum sp. TaxID=45200 RepID=UPI0023739744|nr:deoxyribodipyrimidine photo-lyase [Methanospirillum sp.]MDD1729478.1 deoxyribodipyrimidine photo-lyase [Methanospirillum sp.]
MIQAERVHGSDAGYERQHGAYVLYWMQNAVRTDYNHALEYAIESANHLRKPLLVIFILTDTFPDATFRHYKFLVEGLLDVSHSLAERNIRLQVLLGDPGILVPSMAEDACLLITDYGYLRIQHQWCSKVKETVSCPFIMVESGVIVPVATASPKMEWSAGTFRPKITNQFSRFMVDLTPRTLRNSSLGWDEGAHPHINPDALLSHLEIDRSDLPVPIRGGEHAARVQLSWFVENRLANYDQSRNDPTARATSRLSAYLHFGMISPLRVAQTVNAVQDLSTTEFLEQLMVRRELAFNYVHYNQEYDQYQSAIPEWAFRTLDTHCNDQREYSYTCEELDRAKTHDPYWNAMQTELTLTGYLHGYFRMYWGKKILEWSEQPGDAYQTALLLNNRYLLDGRDPNGFAGIAWCFGRHDRPWKERPVFGTIRYMNAAGLKRKFKVDAYVAMVSMMSARVTDEHQGDPS